MCVRLLECSVDHTPHRVSTTHLRAGRSPAGIWVKIWGNAFCSSSTSSRSCQCVLRPSTLAGLWATLLAAGHTLGDLPCHYFRKQLLNIQLLGYSSSGHGMILCLFSHEVECAGTCLNTLGRPSASSIACSLQCQGQSASSRDIPRISTFVSQCICRHSMHTPG